MQLVAVGQTSMYNTRNLAHTRTLLNLCTSFNNTSPCFTTASYCAFFRLGRVVYTIPWTLSIDAGIREREMNVVRSLKCDHVREMKI